jgi:hypothetical protein
MPTSAPIIQVEIDKATLDRLNRAFTQFGREAEKYMGAAGREISEDIILPTEGVRKYPPADAANAPGRFKEVTFSSGRTVTFRAGYYVRGKGMYQPVRGGGYKLAQGSERYGTQFYTTASRATITIGNRASYARYIGGENQAGHMGARGWRRLIDVATDKLTDITDRYRRWVSKLLNDVGL